MLKSIGSTKARNIFIASTIFCGLTAWSTPSHADPCNINGGLGCGAQGQTPGNNGGNNGGNGGNNGGGNTDPGDGVDQNPNGGVIVPNPNPQVPADPNTDDTIAMAFNKIEWLKPTIHVAPTPETYVRVKTALWVPAYQVADLTVTAAVGPADGVKYQKITATAEFLHIHWELVDGQKNCGPGSPKGADPATACIYTFKTSSAFHGMKAFHITATPVWRISWACQGTCPKGAGALLDGAYESPAGAYDLVVDEIQTEANND